MKSIAMVGRAAVGPQFAKVFVRIVDWDAAAVDAASYQHSSWDEPFISVEIPLDGTIEDLTVVAVCRWGRGVIPYAWLFLADACGRLLAWRCEDQPGTYETIDNPPASDLSPLVPQHAVSSIPRFQLPMTFVLMTRPSSFVDPTTVTGVLQRMQDRVAAAQAPLATAKAEKARLAALDVERRKRIAELEEEQKRREVKAALHSHKREDERRLTAMQTSSTST